MPRGGEFTDGPTIQSDNAIESGENKIAGAPKGNSDVSLPFPSHLHSPLSLLFQRYQAHPLTVTGARILRRRPL